MVKIGNNKLRILRSRWHSKQILHVGIFCGYGRMDRFYHERWKTRIEILRNKPQDNDLSKAETNSTGVVTVSDPMTNAFLYKLRPGNKSSSIFGRINGQETEIKITDKEIRVGTNTFQNNIVSGFAVGIIVDSKGHRNGGERLPPETTDSVSRIIMSCIWTAKTTAEA